MMNLRVAIAFVALTLAVPAVAEPLFYPLDLPPAVSSNFGQYRHGHPHGGVDLWTFHRVDVPVRAVADGTVFRLKVSPYGYGRAVYQRLTDGRIAVYGHLVDLAPKLVAPVATAQRRSGRFRQDLRLTGAQAIRVKRGEVLGLAGDAGTDVPHLHFELRGTDGWPVNPLKAGLSIRDNQPPRLHAVRLQPLTHDARVQGLPHAWSAPFTEQNGDLRAPDVYCEGKVGLAVAAGDRIDGSERDLAPYEVRLFVDDRERFVHRFDRFSYGATHVSLLSYIQSLVQKRQEYFLRLYRLHEQTVFHPTPGTGDLSDLKPGAHRVRVVVTDEAGRRVEGRIRLLVDESPPATKPLAPPAVATLTWQPGGFGVWRVAAHTYPEPQVVARRQSDRSAAVVPHQSLVQHGDTMWVAFDPLHHDAQLGLRPAPGKPVAKWVDYRRAANGRTLAGREWSVAVPQGALYAPTPVTVESVHPSTPPWLAAVGPAVRVGRPGVPVRKKLVVHLKPTAKLPAHAGVYYFDEGTWWHLDAGTSGKASLFGTYALLCDREPPRVLGVTLGGEPPTVKILAADRGSGIASRGIEVTFDARHRLAEYVPLKDQILVPLTPPPTPGEHNLRIVLRDRAGHRTVHEQILRVERP